MIKEFLPYDKVRNNALKLAHKICAEDGFVPDVLYCSLRGGAYMANVISEYYKLANIGEHSVLYAALVARSYTGVKTHGGIALDGWTYPPERLRPETKVMLVDDIFDSGDTINYLGEILLAHGVQRENLKIVVHDYKHFTYKNHQHKILPDYYCRKFEITNPEEDRWIHYMSHELVGLSEEELEKNYFKDDPDLRKVFDSLIKK